MTKALPTIISTKPDKTVRIDHNFEKIDNMRLVTNEKPVKDVDIRIYRKSHYNLGRVGENYVVQRTVSRGDGRWDKSLWVAPNKTYVILFFKKGEFQLRTKVIKV